MRVFTVIKQERNVNIRLHHVDSKLDVLICIKHIFTPVFQTRSSQNAANKEKYNGKTF